MQGSRVASRYAKSLIGLANEQGALEEVYKDMLFLQNTFKHNRDLTLLLQSPIIKTDKKQAILKELFSASVGKLSNAFIHLLASKRREMHLEAIAEEFVAQYKAQKNILTAVITSAAGLDNVLLKQVQDLLKQSSKGEVELIEKTDKDLIGGFVLRMGDKQVDASILRKLKNMQRAFKENPYIKEY